MRVTTLKIGAIGALGTALLIAGCGGGGGGGTSLTGGGPGDPPVTNAKSGTARFSVDVETGQVTVTPLSGDATSRAIFTGTAAKFTSSDLLNDTGELTRRKLAVSLKNNTAEPIGMSGSGFKVMFSDFTTGVSTDLRSKTNVSTLAGSGGSGSADGPGNAARFRTLKAIAVTNAGDVILGDTRRIRLIERLISSGLTQ